jgi:hypothetical protein
MRTKPVLSPDGAGSPRGLESSDNPEQNNFALFTRVFKCLVKYFLDKI